MSSLESIKKSAVYIQPAIAALEAIQMVTGLGGAAVGTGLHVIDAIVKSFIKGVNNDVQPEDIVAEITRLRDSVSANDAAADAALKRKFPK